jgi:hypothetical protein
MLKHWDAEIELIDAESVAAQNFRQSPARAFWIDARGDPVNIVFTPSIGTSILRRFVLGRSADRTVNGAVFQRRAAY